jgi:Tfp pilus assembly protein PilO
MTGSQKKLCLKAGIAAFILVVIWLFVLAPKFHEKNALDEQVMHLSADNVRVKKIILSSDQSGDRLREILSRLAYYRNRLSSNESMPNVLEEIASMAQANRLQVLSLQPLGDEPVPEAASLAPRQGKIQSLIVGMNIRGTFSQLIRYLSELENGDKAILVKELKLKNPERTTGLIKSEPKLEIELKLGILMM